MLLTCSQGYTLISKDVRLKEGKPAWQMDRWLDEPRREEMWSM